MPQLAACPLAPSPSGASQWDTVCHACLGAAPPLPRPGGGCRTGLPARFRLVVWVGVLEVGGGFPIQLQHDPGVQSPNHQSKPAIRGTLRRVPKKGQALRGQVQILQSPRRQDIFCNSGTNIFIISYVSKNVHSSHAKSMLPFSKHRSRDALRAGLVAKVTPKSQ